MYEVTKNCRRSFGAVAMILAAAMAMAGCDAGRYGHAFELNEATFDPEAMKMVETMSGLDIPDGAVGLNFTYTPPIDPAFLARIKIPAEARESVLKQIAGMKENKFGVTGGLTTETAWWLPTKGKVLAEKQHLDEHGHALRVFFAEENGELILYIDLMT